MIKCVVFDLDGTLVDTLKDIGVTTNEILNEYGYSSINLENYRYFVGNGIKKLIERSLIYVNGDLSLLDEAFNKFIAEYQKKCLRFASLYAGIKCVVEKLKNEGYLLYVNTNKNNEISIKMIDSLLPNYFNGIYGDSLNYPRKPNPYILNMIKSINNLKDEEVIFIGDSDVDVITAHNSNVKVIGCCYGFRGKDELIKSGADYLIYEPLEILKIVNN